MEPTEDEVILRVRYTEISGWVRLFILISWGSALIAGSYFWMIPLGKYLRALLGVTAGLVLLMIGLEVLFSKHILFCKDRVVKEWHFFGMLSIPYSRAKLKSASLLNEPRKGNVYVIRDGGTSRSDHFLQVPICCRAYLVSSETHKQLAAVLSYLVGIDSDSIVNREYRLFQRAVLPKEVLS